MQIDAVLLAQQLRKRFIDQVYFLCFDLLNIVCIKLTIEVVITITTKTTNYILIC